MKATILLNDLRRRGVTLRARGDRLQFQPVSAVPPELLDGLRAHKHEILAELTGAQSEPEPMDQIAEATDPPGAVLINSPRFGEVWLALTPEWAKALRDDEDWQVEPRPVLTPDDIERLQGRSPEAIRAFLTVAAAIPGAEICDG
jgi:hypothetical protein